MGAATLIGSGLSTEADTGVAFRAAASAARASLGSAGAHLCMVFASRAHLDLIEEGLDEVAATLVPDHLIGCCAQGVVGSGREVEQGPAVSVWAASLGDGEVDSFHLVARPVDDGAAIDGLPETGAPT
jgi:small ligand-binding sensory domain FIST